MKIFYLLSILVLIFASQSVEACSCYDSDTPPCKRFSDADAIFIGKVEQIVKPPRSNEPAVKRNADDTRTITIPLRTIHFRIEKSFKGAQSRIVKILTTDGTSCDLSIKKGKRWLIYASKDEDDDYYSVGFCGGSQEISKDETDFSYLEELSSGKAESSVTGRITKNRFAEIKDAKVFLNGNGLSLSTRTDGMGFYNFDVPPGKYKIKIVVPFAARTTPNYNPSLDIIQIPTETETSFEYEAEITSGDCHYAYFDTFDIDVKANALIGSRFVSPAMSVFPKMLPELCRVKETEAATIANCQRNYWVNRDGTFAFQSLREGRYVIVVNKDDFPNFDTPFSKFYYPGVKEFSEAQIITLEQGQNLALADFKLPSPAPTTEVSGKIFWKNKKPVLPADLAGNEVLFNFYNPNGRDLIYSMQDKLLPSEQNLNGLKLGTDGSFSFRGFTGYKYIIVISATDKNGKTFYKETEIKIEENPKMLEIILDTPEKD